MQLAGLQFTNTSAVFGNDVSTLPDFPAEIRAPAGSLPGVSAFQVSFSSYDIHTPGDEPDVLVAMNPAALKANLADLPKGGTLIVNTDEFTEANLKKAGYAREPAGGRQPRRLPRDQGADHQHERARARRTAASTRKQIDRSKNFFALGLMFWLYERPLEPTIRWIEEKFAKNPQVRDANIATLKAGYNFGETAELFPVHYRVPKAHLTPGTLPQHHRQRGDGARLPRPRRSSPACRCSTAATRSRRPATSCTSWRSFKNFGVKTFQAEDEIAAIGSAIGAAFGGALGLTGTSGPGLALKSEAIGLAVMAELPIVIVDDPARRPEHRHADEDRAGRPAAGDVRPQRRVARSRSSRRPRPSSASTWRSRRSASRCKYMTPTIFLSDGYLGNGAEPWRIPDVDDLPQHRGEVRDRPGDVQALRSRSRDAGAAVGGSRHARPRAPHRRPGEGRHHRQRQLRRREPRQDDAPAAPRRWRASPTTSRTLQVIGDREGELLVLGWGSTYGAILTAVQRAQAKGLSVSHAHLRHLNPFPKNLGDVLSRFEKVLIPELNLGQLSLLIRGQFLVDAATLNKVTGRPFLIREIEEKINAMVGSKVSV